MDNNCQNIQEQILELIAGTLPAEQATQLQAHIDSCPNCNRYLQALQTDDELLGEFTESMQPRLAQLENTVVDALNRGASSEAFSSVSVWQTIVKSRITRIAAAAVIIIVIGFFITHQGPKEQVNGRSIPEVSKSPAEMMTATSLNIAYRKGGMEAVENRYERVLEMTEPWPSKVSIPELFEELDGS